MHCVAIYPTQNKDMNLNFIDTLKKGIRILLLDSQLEDLKHISLEFWHTQKVRECLKNIGILSNKYKLNNYSVTQINFQIYLKK